MWALCGLRLHRLGLREQHGGQATLGVGLLLLRLRLLGVVKEQAAAHHRRLDAHGRVDCGELRVGRGGLVEQDAHRDRLYLLGLAHAHANGSRTRQPARMGPRLAVRRDFRRQ